MGIYWPIFCDTEEFKKSQNCGCTYSNFGQSSYVVTVYFVDGICSLGWFVDITKAKAMLSFP
jgi:hypothetical protein